MAPADMLRELRRLCERLGVDVLVRFESLGVRLRRTPLLRR
jgi:hypothetical protein